MDNIKNKTVLVTGGASGLGYKYAEYLLRNGAKSVALLDLATSRGPAAVEDLEKEFGKGRAIFYSCDVTNEKEFTESFKKVVNTFNGLDILINNAGILNDADWERSININVTALIRGTLMALDHMGKHKGGKGGTIVNIASIVGLQAFRSIPIYVATKHAVIGFSLSLKEDYDTTGVRVLVMCPGVTETALFDNLDQRVCDYVDVQQTRKNLGSLPSQTTENVAKAMVDLIQKGNNGDVWVSEGGKEPHAISFPHYTERSIPL